MNTVSKILKKLNSVENFDKDQLMERLGVEPLRTAGQRLLPPAGGFGVGFGFGVGVGMLLAPKSGKELRDELGSLISGWFSRDSGDEASEEENEAATSAPSPNVSAPSSQESFGSAERRPARA